jgi:hypothetical protein
MMYKSTKTIDDVRAGRSDLAMWLMIMDGCPEALLIWHGLILVLLLFCGIDLVHPLERSVGRKDTRPSSWNPPWTAVLRYL